MYVNILSWNVLADSYIFGHKKTKQDINNTTNNTNNSNMKVNEMQPLHWDARSEKLIRFLGRTINEFKDHKDYDNLHNNNRITTILSLQEIDHYDDYWKKELSNLGYNTLYTQRPGKKLDGCCVAWQNDKLRLVNYENISFDNLVNIHHIRYQTRNVGMIVRFEDIINPGKYIIVVNVHLFWNPRFPDVKLQQVMYILRLLEKFHDDKDDDNDTPIFFTGDFNTLPSGDVYSYVINNKYHFQNNFHSGKLLLDQDLHKEGRWLRAIGVDTIVWPYTDKNTVNDMFKKAHDDGRILISKSKKLLVRKNCPPSLWISPEIKTDGDPFYQLVTYFKYEFKSISFFDRCTLCNSKNFQKQTWAQVEEMNIIPKEPDANVGKGVDYYTCNDCSQLYWWGKRSKREEERFKKRFEEVYKIYNMKHSIITTSSSRSNSSDGDDIDDSNNKQYEEGKEANNHNHHHNNIHQLVSLFGPKPRHKFHFIDSWYNTIYYDNDCYTNNVKFFSGRLDYIFYTDNNKIEKVDVLTPISYMLSNEILPSKICPSDHIPVGSTFLWK